ncbi:Rsd/AlgQ family anti-sigma factor [Alcanivorax sp. 1008]|uniref:Rsd/AlgQ family anti-sigma factor n=1 Tax=Alcanivorax sp. 1008 TaxID=2816853 RepID=UPI001D9C79CE|nr:Rsd/AlgQ family anti-sigma factor [Alcanivorax sp. 1008]MCC1495860.1 Rsd/AlgQ family anti-sigma factor [Alcanivorax sp. 1008]
MSYHSHAALQQWQRIELLVQQWLGERQQILRMLFSLRTLISSDRQRSPLPQRVQQFCQLLMDYVSAGYFEVYRELAREVHHTQPENRALVAAILQRLEESTDAALAFNDDFDSNGNITALRANLPQRLHELLIKLEERFALEDQLIVSIHQRESPPQRMLVH